MIADVVRSTRGRRAVVGGSMVLSLVLFGSPRADAATEVVEVEGSAFGIAADLNLVVIPRTPSVELPPEGGGPITDSVANFGSGPALLEIDLLEVATQGALGPSGFARSSATLTDFNFQLIGAELIEVECESGLAGPTGTTTLADVVTSPDLTIPDLTPEPNTEIPVPNIGTVTLNRQVVSGDRIEVTGIVIELENALNLDGTIEVGQAVCGVSTADVPEDGEAPAGETPIAAEPSFTG
jgi:hypothetical protein